MRPQPPRLLPVSAHLPPARQRSRRAVSAGERQHGRVRGQVGGQDQPAGLERGAHVGEPVARTHAGNAALKGAAREHAPAAHGASPPRPPAPWGAAHTPWETAGQAACGPLLLIAGRLPSPQMWGRHLARNSGASTASGAASPGSSMTAVVVPLTVAIRSCWVIGAQRHLQRVRGALIRGAASGAAFNGRRASRGAAHAHDGSPVRACPTPSPCSPSAATLQRRWPTPAAGCTPPGRW